MKCLDKNDELTPLGRILAKLPLDPRLGKMLILGSIFFIGDAATTIAASSSNMLDIFEVGKYHLYPHCIFFILSLSLFVY